VTFHIFKSYITPFTLEHLFFTDIAEEEKLGISKCNKPTQTTGIPKQRLSQHSSQTFGWY
jgi:hypothetical protein